MNMSQGQGLQDSAPADKTSGVVAEMRAVPGFDRETGRFAGVTLTRRPPREGASVGVQTERLDLDNAIPVQRGWHWFEDREDVVCELTPTLQDVLEQVADDIFWETLTDYRLHSHEPAEQLREIATYRMSLSPDGAEFECARLLREYQAHLRRVETDDEG